MAGLKFMAKENLKIKKPEPIFPEESGLVIKAILEKYELAKIQQEGIEKILKSKNPEEKIDTFEKLPGTKISKLVKEYAEGKVSLVEIPSRLSRELNISERKAKQITEELENTLLVLIEPVKEEKLPPVEVARPEEQPPEKPEVPKKRDVYREPIE